MSDRANHFKIGIFVLVGLGLFVFALFALGIGNFFEKGDMFETYIDGGVENLSVGAVVKLRGVSIGKVTSISFIAKEYPQYKDQSVLILFEVPKDAGIIASRDNIQQMLNAEVARGLRARIETQGFIGPGIVLLEYVDPKIYPYEPVPWPPKHYYIPSAPSQFSHAFSAIEKILARTEDLDLNALLGRTQKLIETANHVVENINRIDFDRLGTNANEFVVELRETNRGLQRTLTDAQHALADAQDAIKGADLPTVSRNAQALEARLSSAAIELRRLLASVDTGELNNSLANIRSATDELTVLLHTLEQRPSSVLFSKPPKPVSGVEEPPRK
jgi:phospholipid/cholesterol/gamma-HCH transport system substrate-binding protein